MGVPQLNGMICAQCPGAVVRTKLSGLAGKRVVIDASIFLYKYKSQGVLLENLFNMVNVFRRNGITPCFVFDGKPPDAKMNALQARREQREKAEDEYRELMNNRDDESLSEEEKQALAERIAELKVRMTRISWVDVNNAKELLDGMGVFWVEAEGEADVLCARLCIKKYVDACLSDDMDMFVYGCPYVWRHFSLLQESVHVYDLDKICCGLGVSPHELREICVVSGTDYNYGDSRKTNLNATMKMFQRYKRSNPKQPFYEWLDESTNYVEDMTALYKQLAMFDTQYVYISPKVYGQRGHLKQPMANQRLLEETMAKEDFFFPRRNC